MSQLFLTARTSIVLGVAFLVTPLLVWPEPTQGAAIPESLSITAGDTRQVIEPQQFQSWFRVDRETVYNPSLQREIEAPIQCTLITLPCVGFIPRLVQAHFVSESTATLNRELAETGLATILEGLERPPINAKLGIDANRQFIVIAEAVPGISLEREAGAAQVVAALEAHREGKLDVTLPVTTTPARISRETLTTLGIRDLLAEGRTNFRGSPKNRIFNIHRTLEQFDGIVIETGQEFSFVDYLGPVDGENGYLPELVIKNNKTEPEFGGGVCQISTTIFRAAINAGLEITERRNHSYAVQYYRPYGLDATIYIPRPDLKFKNNTPGPILILPRIVGTELTVSFYGISDGRTVAIDGPHILESNPDGSMRTIFTQTVKDSIGNTFINATFPSNYKSPSLFPKPGDVILTEKPKDWSGKQWKEYKAIHP